MLSYRHSFHAGNFADVLKHFCLYEVLQYANRKDKPYLYFDSHAGAGLYDLKSSDAQKNREAESGILRLYHTSICNPALREFVHDLRHWLDNDELYPGSPWLAAHLLRRQDTLQACELHPNDAPTLESVLKTLRPARSRVHCGDGFAQLIASLPPPQRRAVVLIDPPYEDKADYSRVSRTLEHALKRFPTGTYLIWYPLLMRAEARQLPQNLKKLSQTFQREVLDLQLQVRSPAQDGFGMFGCGMFVINPPYTLADTLSQAGDELLALLGEKSQGKFTVNSSTRTQ